MHEIPKKTSLEAIKEGVISNPEHQKKEIVEYVEGQSNKKPDSNVVVTHLEKMKSEFVYGREFVAWDVHTNEPGRWWVVTNPTNLYSQELFPSLDYTLSFHIGLTARVSAREAKMAPFQRKDRFLSTWRRWENAGEALDIAKEPEDFQSIGMMCREAMIELIKGMQEDILPTLSVTEKPKSADFKGWVKIAIKHYASGQRNKHIRSYLNATSKEAWDLANWLTHTSKATLFEAYLVHDAITSLISMFSIVHVKSESGGPDICPKCKSYRVVSVYEQELDEEYPYVTLCEACGWNTYKR